MTASLKLIKASAGSGKTYTLTEEIAQALSGEDAISPQELIATTFTVKAAGELVEKTYKKLIEKGELGAADGLGSALIGTVNSVAGRIVADYAIDGNLSPDLHVLGEEAAGVAFALALDRVSERLDDKNKKMLERLGYTGDATQAVGGFRPFGRGRDWKSEVRGVAEAARMNNIKSPELRQLAEQSWEVLAACLPEPSAEDDRSQWLAKFTKAVDSVRERERCGGQLPDEVGVGRKPSSRSVSALKKDIEELESTLNDLESDLNAASWKTWGDIAGSKNMSALAQRDLAGVAADIQRALFANPELRKDLHDLVVFVFDMAADVLAEYAKQKRAAGVMDFIDQEVLALDLLTNNRRAQSSFRSRYKMLAVDEFQDTSPIQLALFAKMRELVDKALWVGDLKQSIYGFRGADPALMEAVASAVPKEQVETLSHSYRSSYAALDLSNELFTKMFDLPKEEVWLTVPVSRAEEAEDGRIEVWGVYPEKVLGADPEKKGNLGVACQKLAVGVADLIVRDGLRPEDVAVLTRGNPRAQAISEALAELGISSTRSSSSVVESPAGRMVTNALALLAYPDDTVALTELIQMLKEHKAHETWFKILVTENAKGYQEVEGASNGEEREHARKCREQREGVFEEWRTDPSFNRLNLLRPKVTQLSAGQIVEGVIAALQMPSRVAEWEDPSGHYQVLDTMVRTAHEYEAKQLEAQEAVTVSGLADYFLSGNGSPGGQRAGAVFVDTVHQAKGLGFPVTVVVVEEPPKKRQPHGVFTYTNRKIDIDDPLAGRTIVWLPMLPVSKGEEIDRLDGSEVVSRQREREAAEETRIDYVAFTRSEQTTILVEISSKVDPGGVPAHDTNRFVARREHHSVEGSDSLDALPLTFHLGEEDKDHRSGEVVFKCPVDVGLADEDDGQPAVKGTWFNYSNSQGRGAPTPPAVWLPPLAEGKEDGRKDTLLSRMQPSKASSKGHGEVVAVADLGEALADHGGQDWNLVGTAIHAYLALPRGVVEADRDDEVLKGILQRWVGGSSQAPGVDIVKRASERWWAWLDNRCPGARVQTEVPFRWVSPENQVFEGWIDAVIQTETETVIVDHKTYPGKHPVQHIRDKYLGQMAVYRNALQDHSDAPVTTLIHMPLRGEVYEVEENVRELATVKEAE